MTTGRGRSVTRFATALALILAVGCSTTTSTSEVDPSRAAGLTAPIETSIRITTTTRPIATVSSDAPLATEAAADEVTGPELEILADCIKANKEDSSFYLDRANAMGGGAIGAASSATMVEGNVDGVVAYCDDAKVLGFGVMWYAGIEGLDLMAEATTLNEGCEILAQLREEMPDFTGACANVETTAGGTLSTTPPVPVGGAPGDPSLWPAFICEEVMAIADEVGLLGDACVYVPDEYATFAYRAETVGTSGLRSVEMACYAATSQLDIDPVTAPTFEDLPLVAGVDGGNFDFAPPTDFWTSCYLLFSSAVPLSDAGLDAVNRLGNAFLNEIS